MQISDPARNAAVNAITTLLDAGAAAGYIQIRTGAKPATVAAADAGTLLATLTLSKPAFGAAATGVGTAAAVGSDVSVDASGTAGHFRAKDSNNVTVMQGNITATGGGGDMTYDNVNFVAGGTAALTSWTLTMPVGT